MATLLTPIDDTSITAYSQFEFAVPDDTFETLGNNFSATLANGDPLPDWLIFNPTTQTFSGIPTHDNLGTISLTVTADDFFISGAASDTFDVTINPYPPNIVSNTINGGNANDILRGTKADETINGLGGNDVIYGRGVQITSMAAMAMTC